MNAIFFIMLTASLVLVTILSPEAAFSIMLGGAKSAITLAMTLCAIYAIWLSILEIMERIGLNKMLNKLFMPITKKLFKNESEKTMEYISLNFSANLLGMGSAATPLGIKAMEGMEDGSNKATDNAIMFMVINATSIQLLPATIIGLRSAAGSTAPSNIILPSLLATLVSTIFGVILAKLCAGIKRKNGKNEVIEQKREIMKNALEHKK